MSNDTYQSPLNSRYSSAEMKALWSPRTRASTWRKLWLWLAESEKSLGLEISDEAIKEKQEHVDVQDDDFPVIAEEEKKVLSPYLLRRRHWPVSKRIAETPRCYGFRSRVRHQSPGRRGHYSLGCHFMLCD